SPGAGDDPGGHDLAEFRVGQAEHGDFRDVGVMLEELLHLGGMDLLAAAVDLLLATADDAVVAVVAAAGKVAGIQPAFTINGTRSGRGVLVITGHHVVAAGGELAGFARRRVGPGCRVHQLHLDSGDWPADGPAAYFDRVVGRGECDDRR